MKTYHVVMTYAQHVVEFVILAPDSTAALQNVDSRMGPSWGALEECRAVEVTQHVPLVVASYRRA
jgi:hypothetical protein